MPLSVRDQRIMDAAARRPAENSGTAHRTLRRRALERTLRPRRRGSGARGLRHRLLRLEGGSRSEEHTSELQSRQYLVCRLLLEKKKKKTNYSYPLIIIHSTTDY